MNKFKPLLPQLSQSEILTNQIFSKFGAKAIEYGFAAREVRGTTLRWLVVDVPDYIIQNVGPAKVVRILVDQEGIYKFQVLNSTLHDGTIETYFNQMKRDSGYSLCPGVEKAYSEVKTKLKRVPNKLRIWAGKIRYDNEDCQLWFNPSQTPKGSSTVMCSKCNSLVKSMRKSKKKASAKIAKTPPKTVPLTFLTPKTRRKTLTKRRVKFQRVSRKLAKYENFVCMLNQEQGQEMSDIVSKINLQFNSELENLFKEHARDDLIKSIWENDVRENKQNFFKDQTSNKGTSGNRFSVVTYRVALAIFFHAAQQRMKH